MSSNINLVSALTLDRFIVNVYAASNTTSPLDATICSSMQDYLNNQEYLLGIVETI